VRLILTNGSELQKADMNLVRNTLLPISLAAALACQLSAQPRPRFHQITEKGELVLAPADSAPAIENEVTIQVVGEYRVITANGIPNHKTGKFPNRGNPNRISAQKHVFKIPAHPQMTGKITPMRGSFGVAINGVTFDPGAGEFFQGAPGWQYEPLSGAVQLGIDFSHAHVQPTGKYHYHGLPTGLLDSVKLAANEHSPIIGWAADGFPMYAVYGYADPHDATSHVMKLSSSYRLRQGNRPGGDQPDGQYDGTFVADYEFVKGSGDLDECNGRFTVTPDYPEGTYAYFLTEAWPVVPRNYRGTPSGDFAHGPPAGGPGTGDRRRRPRRGAGPLDRRHGPPPSGRSNPEPEAQ
jgi:hypothetical protein